MNYPKSKLIAIAIFFLVVITFPIIYEQIDITGFVTKLENSQIVETEELNLNLATTNLLQQTIPLPNNLNYLGITGTYSGEGQIKIYVQKDETNYLVYFKEGYTSSLITANVIENITENETIETNVTIETQIVEEETIIEEPVVQDLIELNNICMDTCNLNNLETSNLIVELEGNVNLNLISYQYVVEPQITQIQNIENIMLKENQKTTLNLREYFINSDENTYFDISTTLNEVTIKNKNIVEIVPNTKGIFSAQILVTDGEKLIRSNEFTIYVGEEYFPNSNSVIVEPEVETNTTNETQVVEINTINTFVPWLNDYVSCSSEELNLCCVDGTYTRLIGEEINRDNQIYICAIKNENSAWIKIQGGSFQIQDNQNNKLFVIDDSGNAWLKGSKCESQEDISCNNNFKIADSNIYVFDTGVLSVNSISESVRKFIDCKNVNCVQIKNENEEIVAQIIETSLELKGKIFLEQQTTNNCSETIC